MAILKSLIARKAKQKLAGMALYELNGQTVARELAATVTNPRTQAQMAQRMRLANMVQFWKKSRPWSKHGAFENKKSTWSDYNAFVSANMGLTSPYLTKEQVAQGACVLAPYTISRGSLPVVQTMIDETRERFVSNIFVDISEYDTLDGTYSVGAISRSIIANNNGIQDGDQISLIVYMQQVQNGVPYVVCRYYEITLNVNAESTDWDTPWLTLANSGSALGALAHSYDDTTCAAAFVISRKVGGKIQTSTEKLVLNASATAFYQQFVSSTQRSAAIASYGEDTTNFLDPNTRAGGSNSQVPAGLSLLSVSVNGRTYTNGFDRFNVPVGSSIVLNFSTEVPFIENSTVTLYGTNNGTQNIAVTASNVAGSQISVTMTASTFESQQVTKVQAQIGDYTYSIHDNGAGGGDAEPGDVTP